MFFLQLDPQNLYMIIILFCLYTVKYMPFLFIYLYKV